MLAQILTILGAFSSASFAADSSDRACGRDVYCADEMVCVRTVESPPRGMHPSYYTSVVSIKTFKSTTRAGHLVDSLQISDDPTGPRAPTLEEAWRAANFRSGNYGAPMYLRAGRNGERIVALGWGPASNFSRGVRFEIARSEDQAGHRLDRLTGVEQVAGDVVGNYRARYECEAKVVSALSRVDDNTASGNR